MVKIRKQLVSSRRNTYGGGNGRKFITIHETANTARGANAQAHANLQSNGFGSTWHYTVDDKQAIQSFPHSVRCWHAGDGRGNGNMNSIGIEICVNSDGNFYKAVQNAAELTKQIMKQEGIPLGSVVQHNHWSGKNCPTNLRNGNKGVSWSDFKRMVSGSKGKVSKGSTKNKSKSNGGSVVDYINSKGMDSSFSNRKKLAKKYGIKNYRGTASQNVKLLNKLKGNKTKKTSNKKKTSSKSISKMADEVIAGKHGSGHYNRRKSLGISKSEYEKVRKKVNEKLGVKTKSTKSKSKKKKSFKVGQYATLKKSATRFVTGERIADFAKGKKYKIIQVKSDRVLLDGIMSWVYKKDLQ